MELNNIKSNFYDYLFCLLIIILPYSIKFPNILIVILSLFLIFDFKEYSKIDFKILKKTTLITLYILILYWLSKGFLSNTISENKYSLYVIILIVPILFLKIRNSDRILFAIIISVFILSLRSIYGLIIHYSANNELLPFEGDIVNAILGMERPYLGFFSVIAIIISIELSLKHAKYKYILLAYSVYIGLFISVISARISGLTILFLIILYLVFYIKMSFKKKTLLFLVLGLSIFIVILSNKNLRERLFITNNYEESFAKVKLHEPRVIIWGCANEIMNSPNFNHILGLKSEKELDNLYAFCYDEKLENKHRANFFITSKLNSHNQFIGTYLTSGMIGLFLMLTFFISQIIICRANYIKTFMVIALFFFFMVEVVLLRQLGAYFFIIVICIINICPLNCSQKHLQS
jgi:O-antigen ligase